MSSQYKWKEESWGRFTLLCDSVPIAELRTLNVNAPGIQAKDVVNETLRSAIHSITPNIRIK